jgi:carboxyl-terminal processing protease
MKRAKIVGTEMERLAGSMQGVPFKYQKYQYRIATEKLFHINDIAREKYVPWYYVNQTNLKKDVILEKAFALLQSQ